MIRRAQSADVPELAQLWLEANLQAHGFIPAQYWRDHLEEVANLLGESEVYLLEGEKGPAAGFVGLQEEFIAGIFVRQEVRSKGIGKQLLDFVKGRKNRLRLHVYQKNAPAVRFYRREGFVTQRACRDAATGEPEYEMLWTAIP